MKEIKKKIDYNKIAGCEPEKTWGLNKPEKLHHGLSDSSAEKVNDVVQQSLDQQSKSKNIAKVTIGKTFDAARNSGQRAFAKKTSRRSHYITKK